jgi:hypothetical protein
LPALPQNWKLCVPEDALLHPFSHGAELAFFVLQQLVHKYQFSSADLWLFRSVKERFTIDKRITRVTIIFFMCFG